MADRALELVMDCGQAMLANGGEVFRAQDTMEIMARSLGITDFQVYVLTNGIFASAKGGTINAVRHVPSFSTNLGRVEAINAISRKVADGELDLSGAECELHRALDTLKPLDRALVLERVLDGLDYKTLAQIHARPAGYLRTRYNRAKKQLAERLKEGDSDDV